MRKTYIINRKKERFEIEEWSNKYIKYLEYLYKDSNKCINIYNDPDGVKNHIEFYKDLKDFLNDREGQMELKEKFIYELNDKKGIKVKDEKGNWLFTLFSDQFGFSAPSIDKNHPYDVYAEVNDYSTESLEHISNYVYYSRTIGGSFLWPIDGGKQYNMARGGSKFYNEQKPNDHYIEDRVDLTLLEIKKYYDNKKDSKIDVSKDILSGCLTSDMEKWLNHFGDFNTYVKFFYFDTFVDQDKDYMPIPLLKNPDTIDILDGRSWTRIMKGRSKEIEDKEKRSNYRKELETVFENLQDRIIKRTDTIEKELKNKNQKIKNE